MSMHTQLLRGVVVLPMLVLLAVAGMTAPGQKAHAEARARTHCATVVVVADNGEVMVQRSR